LALPATLFAFFCPLITFLVVIVSPLCALVVFELESAAHALCALIP
jgi:hypothetical protein